MSMNTRSRNRADYDQSETDRSPIGNQSDNYKINQAMHETIRCDECDNDVNSDNAVQVENMNFCHSCINNIYKKKDGSNISFKEESSSPFLPGCKGTVIIVSLAVLIAVASYSVPFDISILLDMSRLWGSNFEEFDCRNNTILLNSLDNILKNFPSQSENTLFTFAAGIKRIYDTNPTEPTSFLLLHKVGDKTANCLVKEISKIAANCLTKTNSIIVLNGEQLQNEPFITDSGELIEKYKSKVKETKVMTVFDINQIPGNVIKEFHYFCDTYSPLVKEAVYFFTMSTDDDLTDNVKPAKKAEKKFRELWSTSLDYHLLDPLITRMTTNIIPIISESDYKNDC